MTRGGQTQLLGASGRNVREPPWSGRPTFSSASGQDLRRRANSEMYHGFTIDLLVELVRSELATAQAERVVAGGRAMEIARVRITDVGRSALQLSGRSQALSAARSEGSLICAVKWSAA